MIEWLPKLVGLTMNVLSYRFKDDMRTRLAVFERLVHESQSSETVDDDTKTGVTVLGWRTCGSKRALIWNSVRIESWTQMREEILEIARTQQYHAGQNDYRYRSEIKSKTIGLYQITDVTDLY